MKTLPAALYPWFFDRQFVVVRIDAPRTVGGKNVKTPVSHLTGRNASAQDEINQTDFAAASASADILGESHSIGFAFRETDEYFFIDIDNCLVDGVMSPLAAEIVARFPGAAVEVSNSGKGLHIFGRGRSPAHRCKNTALDLEFYTEQRFALITGDGMSGSVSTDCTAQVAAFVRDYMQLDEVLQAAEWTTDPCDEWSGPEDDDALLAVALSRTSPGAAFGAKASFRDLFEANAESLGKHYPHADKEWDYSSADSALAYHLAYWTGRDCERMERLMRRSPLARDKWEREDYLQGTIIKAAAGTTSVYKQTSMAAAFADHVSDAAAIEGEVPVIEEYVFQDGFERHFRGCVLAVTPNRMFSPKYGVLSADQVRSNFGGKLFVMDVANEKMTDDPWKAFTSTRCGWVATRVDNVAFRPDLEHGEVFAWSDGKSYVNTYKPHTPVVKDGDVSLFLSHMQKLVPNERDRTILTSYMAALAQYPGKKFTWCPVIQGTPGNGKSTLSRCVEYVVGPQHSHWPRSDQIGEKFNSWLFDKVFIGVEDIYVSRDKTETMEILKPMITGESLAKRAMNTDSFTAPICCNFMLTSNHKDGVPTDENDRRFAIFFTAQQSKGDLARDGMSGDYFSKLHFWLKHGAGYAAVAKYLLTYDIPDEFNPAGSCNTRPVTSSTAEAISLSSAPEVNTMREAIASGELGFKGNFISSKYFAEYARAKGVRVPLQACGEVLSGLKYMPHPAFEDGRVTAVLQPDGIKSKLYVLIDSPESRVMDRGEVMKMYTAAQLDLTP